MINIALAPPSNLYGKIFCYLVSYMYSSYLCGGCNSSYIGRVCVREASANEIIRRICVRVASANDIAIG